MVPFFHLHNETWKLMQIIAKVSTFEYLFVKSEEHEVKNWLSTELDFEKKEVVEQCV